MKSDKAVRAKVKCDPKDPCDYDNTCINHQVVHALLMAINFVPDGWDMPLGYNQVIAQIIELTKE